MSRNWLKDEMRLLVEVWSRKEDRKNIEICAPLMVTALKKEGYIRNISQVKRKMSDILRSYTLIKPLLHDIEKIVGTNVDAKLGTTTKQKQDQQGGSAPNTAPKDKNPNKPEVNKTEQRTNRSSHRVTSMPTPKTQRSSPLNSKQKRNRSLNSYGASTTNRRDAPNVGETMHRPTCRYYIRGKCRHTQNGTQCRFAHPNKKHRDLSSVEATKQRLPSTPQMPHPRPNRSLHWESGTYADAVKRANNEQINFLKVAQEMVTHLTWMHTSLKRAHSQHHTRPPQLTQAWPPAYQ